MGVHLMKMTDEMEVGIAAGIAGLIVVLFLIGIGGCTLPVMTHPTKTEAQFNRDNYECILVGEQRSANTGLPGAVALVRKYSNECMARRGWRIVDT